MAIAKNTFEECKNLTNADLLEFYNTNDFDSDYQPKTSSEFKLVNDSIQTKLDKFKQELLAKTKQHSPACEPEIIDIPYLFSGQYDSKSDKPSNALSLFPNPTNGLLLGQKYIAPTTGNATLADYIKKQYNAKGLYFETINTYWAQDNQDNLHCSSHLIRYCNPR